MIFIGDARSILESEIGDDTVDLTFTSPPYFNAKSYSQWETYREYLDFLREVFRVVRWKTKPGRYCVVNTSPVLTPRKVDGSNHQSSRRAIPFDLHDIMQRSLWEFVDDIVWLKPEGAGVGRSKNWTRQGHLPLTWKPEPITEYLMVYRKTGRLAKDVLSDYRDDQREASRMPADFGRGNVWKLAPRSSEAHPAVFPRELAERVIRAYSFVGDIVLDPFAGTGTTVWAAEALRRLGVGIELNEEYLPPSEALESRWQRNIE